MKTYKTVTETKSIEDKVFCDVCKKESDGRFTGEWKTERNDLEYSDTILIRHISELCCWDRDGGGENYQLDIDLCPDCFGKLFCQINRSYIHSEY